MSDFHPVAEIFPMMSDRELLDLLEDIREHGLREPIWLHQDGRIIDGRNRSIACAQLGIEADVRVFAGGDDDLIAFVLSLNLHRRHLSESQRGMIGARIEQYGHGRPDKDANLHLKRSDAAEMLNVSPRSIASAKVVQEQGAPELVAAVDAGEVAVSTAALVAEAVKERVAGMAPAKVKEIVREAAEEARADAAEAKRQRDVTTELNEAARRVDPEFTRDDLGVGVTWPLINALEKIISLPDPLHVANSWPAHLRERLEAVITPAHQWLDDFYKMIEEAP